MKKLLIINPGSTSTKIGIYNDLTEEKSITLSHDTKELEVFPNIFSQYSFRVNAIQNFLKGEGIDIASFDAFVGRGGLLKPISSGTYAVSDALLQDLKAGLGGEHASNLGGILAFELAKAGGKPSFIADPVVVDEMEEIARLSGLPEIQRKSIFHALNQKAVGKRYAKENGLEYKELELIICHLGGGISVGAHSKGKVIDVNNALNGDGPFSPERSGGLPVGQLVDLCFSGRYNKGELHKLIAGKGGFVAYLGTNDARTVEAMIQEGDDHALLVYEAMAYQVAKEIGACATVLRGKVDAVLLTGGIAYSKRMVSMIRERIDFIGPVHVYPGEDELLALAEAGIRVLSGEEEARIYQ